MDPLTKYVGGKGWLFDEHAHLFPSAEEIAARGGTWREPFCGAAAGAMRCFLGRCPVALSDTNGRLIRMYEAVAWQTDALVRALEVTAAAYSRATFERFRNLVNGHAPGDALARAVGVFVILQWGYNGLWRENRSGYVNVSFGKPSSPGKVPRLFDEANLRAVGAALCSGATVTIEDFETAAARARPGDLVYFDPVYEPVSATANFTGYQAAGFRNAGAAGAAEQGGLFDAAALEATGTDTYRLAKCCEKLDARGVHFAVSNSAAPEAVRLFSRWHLTRLQASRNVNSKTSARGAVEEILARNYRTAAG